ncbi:unnamed protein product [Phyllotreta striolata]|uniref:Uncharacterized protein n=1 Tax=Phyllotreta striolata TaxID=444603 RepID=A0A9N9TYG1_PHYSR|nr:unnamed protein product [Phyllotreta striolata]
MILRLIELTIILAPSVLAYSLPVYGTKRYGRTNQQYQYQYQNPSNSYSSYRIVPIGYYKNPYAPSNYHTYPLPYYYPKVYQHPLPYNYYQDHNGYSYYDYSDPDGDYAQEPDNYDEASNAEDANGAFLNNLILAQMYRDNYDDYDEAFAKIEELGRPPVVDETVEQLQQLQKHRGNAHWAQPEASDASAVDRQQRKNKQRKPKKVGEKKSKRAEEGELYSERKPVRKLVSTTPKPTDEMSGGQKEQFEVRPATPVRHAFSDQVMDMMARNEQEHQERNQRSPSVYDTIKHLLDMEKSLENNRDKAEMRPAMKKRIITPEESLTRQLSVLKKAQ